MDGDEEELERLRKSKQYQTAGRKPHVKREEPESHEAQDEDEDEEDGGKQQKRSTDDDEEEKAAAQLRSFFPTSFGAALKDTDPRELYERVKRSEQGQQQQRNPASGEEAKQETDESSASSSSSSSSSSAASSSSSSKAAKDKSKRQRQDDSKDKGDGDDGDGDDDGGDDDDDDDGDENEGWDPYELPVSHEGILSGHTRTLSALALDPSGSRLLTGSYDYTVKFWDFAGMNETLRSFRSIEPLEGHQINHLAFSLTGENFLVISGSARAKVYSRDGFELCQTSKGYQYIQDMSHTQGHVTGLTHGAWHPSDKKTFITSSLDGTVRVWDMDHADKNKQVIKLKTSMKRAAITACCFSPSANSIAAAGSDGSIQIWDSKSKFSRPSAIAQRAHEPNTDTSSLKFSADNWTMCSRGRDATLKVWDVRKFSSPTKTVEGVPNDYPQTDVLFSPREDLIVTGASRKKSGGQVLFFDRRTLTLVKALDYPSPVVRVLWHPKINQVVIGCADAKSRILFDPKRSKNGALLSVGRKARPREESSVLEDLYVDAHNPHALPMYQEENKHQKKRNKQEQAPKPELPGPQAGKEIRAGRSYMQYMVKHFIIGEERKIEDPREAILAHSKQAEENPVFFGAYRKTQPKTIFENAPAEEEEEK